MRKTMLWTATAAAILLAGCTTGGPSGDLEDGWKLMRAEDYAGARDKYIAILAEYPDNPYAHLNLGVAYQQLGDTTMARRHYEDAVRTGGEAEITEVVTGGEVTSSTTTVAEKGRANLATLGG